MQLGLTLTTLPYDSGADFKSTGNALQSSGHTETRSCTRHPQQLAPRHTLGIECQIADGQGEQLNRLLAGYFDRVKQALEMQLPDGPSDRLRASMAVRSIATMTTMWIFNSNVWSAFNIWHSVRLMQAGNLLW